ncbi:MAG: hypothetical protein J5997_12745 [Oscillospiraceae bacterium]|nr:hypothetical protein [Oscillospiraceae bacterium]
MSQDYLFEDKNGNVRINRAVLAQEIIRTHHILGFRSSERSGLSIYTYGNGVYILTDATAIKGMIQDAVKDSAPQLLTIGLLKEVLEFIKINMEIKNLELMDSDEDIINFRNGLYHISSGCLTPHTPNVLSSIQIPCNYNGSASPPETFNSYLTTLSSRNADTQRVIRQFLAASISNIYGYRFKKALFLIGPGNTGKSQIRQLANYLIGERNCSSQDIFQMESRFGPAGLYGKRLAGSADMSYSSIRALDIFKKLTGGDSIFAEYKGINGFDFIYRGLIWSCGNAMPEFGGDHGEWVYNRMIIIECNNVIPADKQDKRLLEKLKTESEGIVAQCMAELRGLTAHYSFHLTSEMNRKLEEYRGCNDPVVDFFQRCCEMRSALSTKFSGNTSKEIYDFFLIWCEENYSGAKIKKSDFRSRIAGYLKMRRDDIIKKECDNTYFIFDLRKDLDI